MVDQYFINNLEFGKKNQQFYYFGIIYSYIFIIYLIICKNKDLSNKIIF